MKYKTRIVYTEEQKAVIWERWQKGGSIRSIARLFDKPASPISRILSKTGGIRPPSRIRSSKVLTLTERKEISRGLVAIQSVRSIADLLNRSPSTISREINRNGGYSRYRTTKADQAAWDRALRPKLCKLACNKILSQILARKLKRKWSPEQISGWLKKHILKMITTTCHMKPFIEVYLFKHEVF